MSREESGTWRLIESAIVGDRLSREYFSNIPPAFDNSVGESFIEKIYASESDEWSRGNVESCECTGRTANLVMGRLSSVVAVLSVTTLQRPSLPGCSAVTRARGHFEGGNRSSVRSTNEPTWIWCEGWYHLEIESCRWSHSVDHLDQKYCIRCCINCQRARRVVGTVASEGSGIVVKASPMRKCPGVRAARS